MYGRIGYLAAAIALTALTLLGCGQEKVGDRPAQAKAQQPPPQTAEHQRVRDSTQSSWPRSAPTRTHGRAE